MGMLDKRLIGVLVVLLALLWPRMNKACRSIVKQIFGAIRTSGNEGTTKRTVVEGLEDLPPNAVAYKRLPVDESALWDKDSFPKGLRKKHNTRAGTWGKLVVERGKLMYQRLEPELAEFELDTTNYGVVQPQVYHQIKPLTDDLLFSLTFFRLPDEDSA